MRHRWMKGGEWRFYVACVFIYFAYSVHLQVIPEVVRMLVCEEELGANWQRADCKTDDDVTRVTSSWLPLVMGSYYLGEVLVAGLLAHYVDIGRHRSVSLVSCLALALQAAGWIAVDHFRPPVRWALAGQVVSGLLGGHLGFGVAMFAGITAFGSASERSRLFVMLEASLYAGEILGNLLAGRMHASHGTALPFLCSLACLGAATVVLAGLVLPDTQGRGKSVGSTVGSTGMPDGRSVSTNVRCCGHVTASWYLRLQTKAISVVFKAKPAAGWQRATCNLVIVLLSLLTFDIGGYHMVVVLFLGHKFDMSDQGVGYILSIREASRVLILLLIIRPLLRHRERSGRPVPDVTLSILGFSLYTLVYAAYALAPTVPFVYACPVLEGTAVMAMPILKSIVSKSFTAEQQGTALTGVLVCEALAAFFAPLVFNPLYAATEASCEDCTFLSMSALAGVCAIAMHFGVARTVRKITSTGSSVGNDISDNVLLLADSESESEVVP